MSMSRKTRRFALTISGDDFSQSTLGNFYSETLFTLHKITCARWFFAGGNLASFVSQPPFACSFFVLFLFVLLVDGIETYGTIGMAAVARAIRTVN